MCLVLVELRGLRDATALPTTMPVTVPTAIPVPNPRLAKTPWHEAESMMIVASTAFIFLIIYLLLSLAYFFVYIIQILFNLIYPGNHLFHAVVYTLDGAVLCIDCSDELIDSISSSGDAVCEGNISNSEPKVKWISVITSPMAMASVVSMMSMPSVMSSATRIKI
jgi:hypothetical protein